MKCLDLHIGIDPGLKGAIAGIRGGKIFEVHPMPLISNRVSFPGVVSLLEGIITRSGCERVYVSVEEQFYSSEDGKDRIWKTSSGYECILNALTSLVIYRGFNVTAKVVPSRTWKAFHKVIVGGDATISEKKKKTAVFVQKVYGKKVVDPIILGPRKGVLDGLSDAIAIATYAAMT